MCRLIQWHSFHYKLEEYVNMECDNESLFRGQIQAWWFHFPNFNSSLVLILILYSIEEGDMKTTKNLRLELNNCMAIAEEKSSRACKVTCIHYFSNEGIICF